MMFVCYTVDSMPTLRFRPGFTLLEFFLTIAIFAVLLSITVVISFNAIARTNLRSSENALQQFIRRAQTQSQQNIEGKQWGVQIDTVGQQLVLFSGDSFATLDETDATFDVNENIIFSGSLYEKMQVAPGNGLVFERFTGDPVESTFSGIIIMTMLGSTRDITVNGRGVVER